MFKLIVVTACVIVQFVLALIFPGVTLGSEQLVFSEEANGDLSSWNSDLGVQAEWQVVDGYVEGLMTAPFARAHLLPIISADLSNGYRFELEFTPMEGADHNLSLGVSDHGFYDLHWVGDGMFLQKIFQGQMWWEQPGHFTLNTGQSYLISITHQNGLIQVTIDGQPVFSYQDVDPPTQIGRPALQVATGSVAPTRSTFDHIKVFALTGQNLQPLAVPLLKQIDPDWKDQVYDHADTWSPEQASIGNWGCALTSLAMVMQYHQILQMPNALPVTPATLNDWLISQPDGYLGEGLLNWVAATRLIKQLHHQYATTKLEYRRHLVNATASAQMALSLNQPPILQLPNHFVVGTAALPDSDFMINDPAFEYQLWSQHQQTLVSSRTFTPSQTDLSYLVIAFPLEVQFVLTDPNGQVVEPVTNSLTESATAVAQNSPSTAIQLIEVPKPITGTYQLQLSAAQLADYQVTIWSYDQAASPTDLSVSTYLSPLTKSFLLNYSNTADSHSKLWRQSDWPTFTALFKAVTAHTDQNSLINVWLLDRLLNLAIKHGNSTTTFPYYQLAINRYLQQQPPPFSKLMIEALLEELESVQILI